eukprot:COSAG02_NODE_62506_length_265_cov_1.554217_1_plen_77_part_10
MPVVSTITGLQLVRPMGACQLGAARAAIHPVLNTACPAESLTPLARFSSFRRSFWRTQFLHASQTGYMTMYMTPAPC